MLSVRKQLFPTKKSDTFRVCFAAALRRALPFAPLPLSGQNNIAPVSGSGVGVKTHSEATAAENIVCLFFGGERYLLRSLSGSGADAETHAKELPNGTASND